MSKILGFLAGLLGVKALKISIAVLFYTAVLSFYAFILASLIQFYNLIHHFLSFITNSPSTTDLSKFFGLLHCIGFTDAFTASLPVISASLVFLFSKLGWRLVLKVKKDFVDTALKLI